MTSMDKIIGVPAPVDEDVLDQEVAAYVFGTPAPEGREPWRISNLGQADWAMRKLADIRRAEQDYNDQLALWNDAKKRATRAGEFFETLLEDWGVESRTKDRKTFALAHGTVATRESKPRAVVTDKDALLAWAKVQAPDAIKTTEEVLVSHLGEAAKIGAVIVGFEATDKATGDIERIMVDEVGWSSDEDDKLGKLRAKMGDGYVVEPILEPAVLGPDDTPVPGMAVAPGKVTATVTPLML